MAAKRIKYNFLIIYCIIFSNSFSQENSYKNFWGMYFNAGKSYPMGDFKYNATKSDNFLELAKRGDASEIGAFYFLNKNWKLNLKYFYACFGLDNSYILNRINKDTINAGYYWSTTEQYANCKINTFFSGLEYNFHVQKLSISPELNVGFCWFNSQIHSYFKLKEKNTNYTQTIFIRNDKTIHSSYFSVFPGMNIRYNLFDNKYYMFGIGLQATYYHLKPKIGVNFTFNDLFDGEERKYQPSVYHSKEIKFVSILGSFYLIIKPSFYKLN